MDYTDYLRLHRLYLVEFTGFCMIYRWVNLLLKLVLYVR